VRLLFAGTPTVALPSLAALLGSRHDVVAVLTRPPAAAGRGRVLTPSPVSVWADEHDVPVLAPHSPRDAGFLDELAALASDCVAVVAYGALVPPVALVVPPHGWVNLHFSVLPAWRGAAPVQHALLAGDDVTGATTFRLEEGLDTGPVYGVVTETVRSQDAAADLLERLSLVGARLLVATLDGIEDGSLAPVPQSSEGVSYAPRLTPADARVDWSAPAMRVDRLVRATTPEPGAWTVLRGDRVGLDPVQPVAVDAPRPGLRPGELLVGKSEVLVGTGSTSVRLGSVRPHGRRQMSAADWARGLRLAPGERFEP
jgi:methionyl-tRNA formyltransferase